MFEMKSEYRNFLKSTLKDICFATLKSYSFNKIEKKLSEGNFIALKNLIERKDLVILKAGVRCVHLIILPKNLYLLPRINHY